MTRDELKAFAHQVKGVIDNAETAEDAYAGLLGLGVRLALEIADDLKRIADAQEALAKTVVADSPGLEHMRTMDLNRSK